MEVQILEHLNSKIEERVQELIQFLSRGSANSFDGYKEICGKIAGMRDAQLEIAEMIDRFKKHED